MNAAPALLSVVQIVDAPPDQRVIGVVAKRTYQFAPGRLGLAPMQVPLALAPSMTPSGELAQDMDPYLQRPFVDLVVRGHAYSYGAARTEISLSVGEHRCFARVSGDRRLEHDAHGRARFSDPEPWDRLPLSWTRAYGGVDLDALAQLGDPMQQLSEKLGLEFDPRRGRFAYPRNPLGRGWLVAPPPPGREVWLPNFEDPRAPLAPETLLRAPGTWPSAPMPSCFGFLPHTFFPRSVQLGLPPPAWDATRQTPEHFPEVQWRELTAEQVVPRKSPVPTFDRRVNQSAALGMRAYEVTPGMTMQLEGLHEAHRALTIPLSFAAPRLVLQVPDEPPRELAPRIRSVLVEPDENRLVVVWIGEHRASSALSIPRAAVQHAVIWGNDA